MHTIKMMMLVGLPPIALLMIAQSDRQPPQARQSHGQLTGDIKLVFYVSDVRKSVEFFTGALGLQFHHYYDHIGGDSVKQWPHDEPPIYAEMSAGGRRFGLHLPQSDWDRRAVGTMKVYFRVQDLQAHHNRAVAWGADPGKIKRKPWMDMFLISDPDGHRIYFAYTNKEVHGNPW